MFNSRVYRSVAAVTPVIILLICQSTWAVIINSATGVENVTSPSNTAAYSDFSYWNNVGECGVGTGIYLGNGWVLTAYHVVASGTPSITLNGTVYNPVANSTVRIGASAGAPTDMAIFQLTQNPGLPSLTIASSTPSAAKTLLMIGDGDNRQTNQSTSSGLTGYFWDTSARTRRWGTNNRAGTGSVDDGFGVTQSFDTIFDQNGGVNECQAADGDSGGGVFVKVGNTWELAGMMFAIDKAGGDIQMADYTGQTYCADLSKYSAELIPEPATLSLLAIGGLAMLRRRKSQSNE